ncbi:g10591 [Coccomyxa viridis]|uniref:G10591 protein n=1 Tax=Coccomyxa viridis TaxID=1274662 RepID=A0ABP1G651_9CHLO
MRASDRDFGGSAVLQADSSAEGPPKQKLSALPFRVSQAEASASFDKYHSGNFFLTQPSAGLQRVKESFLPFWAVGAKVDVRLHGASLGYDSWQPVYNPATRRFEQRLVTNWRQVQLNAAWQRLYSQTDEAMQVYASYKYPRTDIQRLRPGKLLQQATDFTPNMLSSPDSGESRRVGPFHMKPATAIRFVTEVIREEEQSAASDLLRSQYRADRVAGLQMSVNPSAFSASPFYVPAFVFRSFHFGAKMHTFVSGLDAGKVAGQRAYDEGKTAVLAGLAAGAGILLSQGPAVFTAASTWIWGIALPMTVAGVATHYLASLRLTWARFWQQRERDRYAEQNRSAGWDAEWVHAYSQYEEQQRQQDQREHSDFFGQSAGYGRSFNRSDPMGYYGALGVEPGASKQGIQAAFRGLALKNHPDHVPESDRAVASRKFQKINEAYSVLRDPIKRRQYDRGS